MMVCKLGMSHLDVGKESEPYDLFVFAINSEETREKYITRMKKFLEIIGIDEEKKLPVRCLETRRSLKTNGW